MTPINRNALRLSLAAAACFALFGCYKSAPNNGSVFNNPSDGYAFDTDFGVVKLSNLGDREICYTIDGTIPEIENGVCAGDSTQTYQESITLQCAEGDAEITNKTISVAFEWPKPDETDGFSLELRDASYSLHCTETPFVGESVELRNLFALLKIDQQPVESDATVNSDQSFCSGSLLRPGIAITATQCLDGVPIVYTALRDEFGLEGFAVEGQEDVLDETGNPTGVSLVKINAESNPQVEVNLPQVCSTEDVSIFGREAMGTFSKRTLFGYSGDLNSGLALPQGFIGGPGLTGQTLLAIVLQQLDGSLTLFNVCDHLAGINAAAAQLNVDLAEPSADESSVVNSLEFSVSEGESQICNKACRNQIGAEASSTDLTISIDEYTTYGLERGNDIDTCHNLPDYNFNNPESFFDCIERTDDIVMKSVWLKFWVPGARDFCRIADYNSVLNGGIFGSPGESHNEYKACLAGRQISVDPDYWPVEVARHCENTVYVPSKFADYNAYWNCYRDRGFEYTNDSNWINEVRAYCRGAVIGSPGEYHTQYKQCLSDRDVALDQNYWAAEVARHCDNTVYIGGKYGDHNAYRACYSDRGLVLDSNNASWTSGVRGYCRNAVVRSPGESHTQYKRCLSDRRVALDPVWWPREVARHCDNAPYGTSRFANYNPYWACYRDRGLQFNNNATWKNGVRSYCRASNTIIFFIEAGYRQCLRDRRV